MFVFCFLQLFFPFLFVQELFGFYFGSAAVMMSTVQAWTLSSTRQRGKERGVQMSKKYGPIFTVYLGPKKMVVLAGYETVKQALVHRAEEFEDRDINPMFSDFNQGHGILFSNGENWKAMRRFALSPLRDFGMGKRGSEERIIDEIQYLKEVFKQFKGKPFDNTGPVTYAVSNIISAIVYGSRFDYSDPVFQDMVHRSSANMKLMGSPSVQLYNMFPWLRSWIKNRNLIMINRGQVINQINELVEKLQESLNPQDCRGVVDCFLAQQKKAEESGEKNSFFHRQNLLYTVANLFGAGTDTTAATLRWGFLFMAKYPHIQDRVHEEIDRVIGGRQPVMEDRKNLPYTDAVIHEVQRLADVSALGVPHSTTCDVTFQGYFIKKGTTVLPLLASVLNDENEWESPHTFNPAHFLDKQGRFVKKDAFLPFSAGRRICVGESLAKMELFLFFSSLLQHFHFTPPPGVTEDQLDLTPVVGTTLTPTPHELCAVSRIV
ncbi:cytochrome P450 2K4-like isoform X2 [Hoplias malabaricus]|uniref:cytochrome P450 2K4-like isoform X2 n=2 Tax=Hoplias malabaricus TaxID=27720 RepID=UPI0034619088